MPSKTSRLYGSLFVAAVLVVALASSKLVAGYSFHSNMAQAVAGTLAGLFAATLFVERGMALVNAVIFGETQRAAEVMIMTSTPGGLEQMADVLGSKERLRLLGSFLAGLFVSAAGVRALEGLLETNANGAPANVLLFPVDVVLTAALIAGGSNGLAFLLQLTKDRMTSGGAQTPVATTTTARKTDTAPVSDLRARLTTTG